jgi:hypothetical protein
MAKTLAKKSKKRITKSMLLNRAVFRTGKLRNRGLEKGSFSFPSNKSVQAIDSDGSTNVRANTGLKKLQRAYKSAGYEIFGTTDDGVVIVRPRGTPDSFRLKELQRVFSGTKHASPRRAV